MGDKPQSGADQGDCTLQAKPATGVYASNVTPTGPGGVIANLSYDALGRLTRQTDYMTPGGGQAAVDRIITYNNAGQITVDTTRTRRSDGQGNGLLIDTVTNANYDSLGTVLSSTTSTNRYRNANDYSGLIDTGQGAAWGTNTTATTSYNYDWYQGAVQTSIGYQEGTTTARTTTFTLANVAGQAITTSAYIGDGRARTVTFDTDMSGQVIRRRETDGNYGQGDPSSMWYRFGGQQMGMITNNGGWEGSYGATIAKRTASVPEGTAGAFAGGSTFGIQEEQFSSNLEMINSYSQGSSAGGYTVRAGDSLQAIAQNIYGDSSLWYKIAEANGLSGTSALFEGQTLRLPSGVIRNTYNASSIR